MTDETAVEPIEFTAPSSVATISIAPCLYIDGAEAFVFNNEVVKFNLYFDTHFLVEQDILGERRIAAHLVMSARVLSQIHAWLGARMTEMQTLAERVARESKKLEPGGA
jgi:hypothetical protein